MLKFGILRSPSGYSLSETMQTAALQYLNINGEYKSYGVKPEELENVFNALKKEGINGLNVTIPHKISVIPLLDELTETAKLIGAVNTILFKDGKSIGENTDAIGFWEAIPEKIRKKIPGENIVMIGCGGAAHACTIALILNNANRIKIYGRNVEKLTNLKKFLTSRSVETKIKTDLIENIDLSTAFMLVNTTPVGMYPDINDSLVSKKALSEMQKGSIVYDIIYKPLETKLLKDAKSLGLKPLNGIEMLVRQGAASLNLWLEKEVAPISVMRMAALNEFVEAG